jgi:hypothetical protein
MTVHYIIAILNYITIQKFVLEMEIASHQEIVLVIMDGHLKIVKHIHAIQYLLI